MHNIDDIIQQFPLFAENFLTIVPKDAPPCKFKLNYAQLHLHRKLEDQLTRRGLIRALVLKGRQQGCSTYTQGRFFHKVITTKGKKAFILTHEGEATKNIFGMTRRFYDNLPEGFAPQADTSSAKELRFNIFNSGYSVGTAGSTGVGRSQTLQLFHGSEVAFWDNADMHAKGVLQAVARLSGTEIILESTANGIGNYFHQLWMSSSRGDTDFECIFIPWYWDEGYKAHAEGMILDEQEETYYKMYESDGLTKEALAWRRLKIRESKDRETGEELFKQEYPFYPEEAFLNPIANTFIKSRYVMKARKEEVDSQVGLIIGVDPAGDNDGADRTTFIRRRGRSAYGLEVHRHRNTMEIAGLLVNIIKQEHPVKVYIDSIGIGKGIVDRLQEMGYTFCEGINVAERALDRDRFKNRRAELWSEMADWFMQDMPVQIPDIDELQNDLCSVSYKYNSSGQLIIEGKDDLRSRGLPSPDCADALMHTFHGGFYEAAHAYQPKIIPVQHASKFI